MPWPWVELGNLHRDADRLIEAANAYDDALRIDSLVQSAHRGRLWVRRDLLGEGAGARRLMDELSGLPKPVYGEHLQEALFAAYDSNWGLAIDALSAALQEVQGISRKAVAWLQASAVLLHLNYGAELLSFLERRGDASRLRPWVEALRALQLGDRRALQNIAPEIRTTAEELFDEIESILKKLPEKTRRRPLPTSKARRSRKSKPG